MQGGEISPNFNDYNEPADATTQFTWADWRPTGQLLIDAVRKHSNNLTLGSGPEYTSDLSDVPKNPYSDSNLVYVSHMYPGNVLEGEEKVTKWRKLFGFLADTHPVIVTEWGYDAASTDPTYRGTLTNYAKPLIDYLDQKNVHWVAFRYFPIGTALVEKDFTTLTEFGKFVKERLQN